MRSSTPSLLIAQLGCSLALSTTITSASTTASAALLFTPLPLTQEPRFLRADVCPQSCVVRWSSQFSSSLSCSGDGIIAAACVCQSAIDFLSSAYVCGLDCGVQTITTPTYRPQITAKVIISDHCSSNGYQVVSTAGTAYWTPNFVGANIRTASDVLDPTNVPLASSGEILESLIVIKNSTSSGFSSTDNVLPSLSYITPPSTPATFSPRTNKTVLSPGSIAGITSAAVFVLSTLSLIYILNKRQNRLRKSQEEDLAKDVEDGSQTQWPNHRLSQPFDKVVEVCEFREGQFPKWMHAQRTTLAIDTQSKGANYVSPDLVKNLKLTPTPLTEGLTLKGVGEEEILVDQEVRLVFRNVGVPEGKKRKCIAATFFVLNREQDEFGLLLGTPDCLNFNLLGRAVFVIKQKNKEQKLKEPKRDSNIDLHREKQKADREHQKKDERKKKHRDDSNRNKGGGSGGNIGRQDSSGKASRG